MQHPLDQRTSSGMQRKRCERIARFLFSFMLVGLLSAFAPASRAAIPQSERMALLEFYFAANGSTWDDSSGWLGAPGTECTWIGVNCDANQSHVTELNLAYNNLSGHLSPVAAFTELQVLDLDVNSLSGGIPDLSNLSKLNTFSVNSNHLSGAFPSLNDAAPLVLLDLGFNAFSGPIPPLKHSLQWVGLSGNFFTGTVPDLWGLTNLAVFAANNNQLTGPIPVLSGLSQLHYFNVAQNQLDGSIPPIYFLSGLTEFYVSNNNLTGQLPNGVDYPGSLQYFDAGNNLLSGSMPNLSAPFLFTKPLYMYRVGGNLSLTGEVGTGPSPNTLHNGESTLCPSGLTASNDSQVNAQWSAATGHTPWHTGCAQQPVVMVEPFARMSFDPPAVVMGTGSQMTIVISNPNAQAITGLAFTDLYPAGIRNSPTPILGNTCGGSVIAPGSGTGNLLTLGMVPGYGTCTVVIAVEGTAAGAWLNSTGVISSDNAPDASGRPSTAESTLTVTANALPPAPVVTKAFAPSSVTVGGHSQLKFLLENVSNTPIFGAHFVDDFPMPSHIANAAGNAVMSNTCSGNLTALPNGMSVELTNGVIPAHGQCAISIDVIATSTGGLTNHTGAVTYGNANSSADATADLVVSGGALLSAPTVTASFLPADIASGDATQMTITLSNPNFFTAITGVQFADTYQGGMVNADSDIIASDTCGGVAMTVPLQQSMSYSSGTIPANGSCSVVVNLVGTDPGTWHADTGAVASANAESGASASATLTVRPDVGVTSQTIAFTSTAPMNAMVAGATYLATATATSGLPVVLTIDNTSATVCAINNGAVSFIGAGTCTIDANQGGDAFYAPATQVQQSFTVDSAVGVTPQTITFTSTAPMNATVAGANYLATATATSGLPVVLTIDNTSATVCTIDNGVVSFIGAGTCTIDANQGGNSFYAPASQVQQSFTVDPAGGVTLQTITFTSTAPVDATVAGATYLATATATSGLPVMLTIDNTSTTVCAISNDTVSFIGAGTCTIDANQGGDAMFAVASQVQQSFTVDSAGGVTAQTITFNSTAPMNATVGGATYLAIATATSGLPVVLTIDNTSATMCTINNGTVSFIGAGTCTIDANQGGDATFAAASQTQQSFTVMGAGGMTPQTITFTSPVPTNAVVAGPTYLAMAEASSGLPVVLTIDNTSATVCTISNGTVSLIGAGTCTIDANQGGDATYAAAPQAQQSFQVDSAGGILSQTITFTSAAPVNATVGGPTYLVTATATSALPVVLTIDNTSVTVCTINNGTVSFVGAGTCTIDANQGGDATYAPASQVQQSFAVSSGAGNPPTVLCTLPTQIYGVGEAVDLDLSLLFAPPALQSLTYSASNLPPSLSIIGSLLMGTLQASDMLGSPYLSTLEATTVPGGVSATEDVTFQILPTGEILLRDGFDTGTPQPCQ